LNFIKKIKSWRSKEKFWTEEQVDSNQQLGQDQNRSDNGHPLQLEEFSMVEQIQNDNHRGEEDDVVFQEVYNLDDDEDNDDHELDNIGFNDENDEALIGSD
jgi:hypothetical protein